MVTRGALVGGLKETGATASLLRRGYAECRFGQLHYLEGCPARASDALSPTLVMLHQTPSSSEEYRPLITALAGDRRVIAFDTPGYGMSDPPPRPLSIAAYAASFADAIDGMGLGAERPLDVFGFHTGALLAIELVLARPDAIGRLVLSGIPMRSGAECAERLAAARASPVATEDGGALLAQSAALWRYVVAARTPGVPLDRAVALFSEKNKPFDRGWWAYEGVWSYRARERLQLITQPTLVLQPHDSLLTQSREACALIPLGRFQDLPDLDRDIFELGADPLAAAMRAFLTPINQPHELDIHHA